MNFLIHHFLDHHARRAPDSAAACFLDSQLTYAELAKATDRLANCLSSLGVSRGDRVGIYMNKSLQTPVALYGIMKTGAAYVPLDPSAPPARIADIISDCGIRVLVSASDKMRPLRQIMDKFPEVPLVIIGVDDLQDLPIESISWEEVSRAYTATPPLVSTLEDDLAYIIYTSGSTGQPKGIMHTHRSGLSFSHWAVDEYNLDSADRLSNHAPLHFDMSIFDYFAAIVAGACTVIIPEEYTKLPASYSQLIADQKISVLFTVPFALTQLQLRGALDERDLQALRWVIFGGEPMPTKHLYELMRRLPETRFDNMYGPAEINGVTHYTVESLSESTFSISIGALSKMAEALVLDESDEVVEGEGVGELLVRTPTMMQGYWRRPDLNQAAFHTCERDDEIRAVFYRTGDLVSRDAEGLFWFRGRKDRQVKIRGYRVELDEIESYLVSHLM